MGHRKKHKAESETNVRTFPNDWLEYAFPPDALPPSGNLVMPFSADPDRASLAALLAGKFWPSVTWPYLREKYTGTSDEVPIYMTSTGLRFFLPALIRMCLRFPNEVDCMPSAMLSCFSRDNAKRAEIIANLTEDQMRMTGDFFRSHFSTDDFYRNELNNALRALNQPEVHFKPPYQIE